MIIVVKLGGYFGIMENGEEVVPFIHNSKESAIEEWVYFEKLNLLEMRFLDHVRTIEEIEKISCELNLIKE